MNSNVESITCPYCDCDRHHPWGSENGFSAVKCDECGLVYVNPRPKMALIDEAVKTGAHSEEANSINVVTRRVQRKVGLYKSILKKAFPDVFAKSEPIRWLDIGAGFGEVVEAVSLLAPEGSTVEGIEPMHPKVIVARSRGLTIHEKYLDEIGAKYDFVSLINVFSHIPDFRVFLADIKNVLTRPGELFIETGNVADMDRAGFPGVLSLPDHLVFGGERHLEGYLKNAGFEIVSIRRVRYDNAFESIRNIGRFICRQPVVLSFPYSSKYRSLLIRARLV